MNKALFLDRDGVINVEKNYVYKIEDFEFVNGIFELAKHFVNSGYLIIVITNQAGIGRGFYSERDFHILNNWMVNEFTKQNIKINKVYYCPYHPIHGIGKYKKDSFFRKPNPGMILNALQLFDIDPQQSILIGDSITDIEAGLNSGIKHNILIGKQYSNDFVDASLILENLEPDKIINYLRDFPNIRRI
ncbi:HAD family hydrolase [Paenibacillus alginolyticus]|uniref:D-glycero-alpha-D-manno-heptose-1,7-bisphosphate 7-phosphatase n=1 Tax=Paenibacillus alginolyticus TaxID=59839 RepID=UPI0003F90B3A|nr:HAD family hydrolase [Paenibacillus alginolyticus]MCY9664836.1 HAD family hydrolase [Paenibacillus alginolyticus]